MTIKQLISSKVSTLTSNSLTYAFSNCEKSYDNMLNDETLTPYILLAMPTIVTPKIVNGGRWVEVYECLVFALFKSQLDDSDIIQEQTFNNAKNVLRELLIKLENDEINVANLVIGKIEQVQHMNDCDRSGALINFSLEIINDDSVCV